MRYGYDFNNPKEREMYFEKRKREIRRQIDNVDINEGLKEIIEERQKEMEYFREREKEEKELKKIKAEIPKEELEKAITKALNSIFSKKWFAAMLLFSS